MKTVRKKEIKAMLEIWLRVFEGSDGMNIYNRELCQELRKAGFSIAQLQDQIAVIKIKHRDKNQSLTPIELEVMNTYLNLDIESDVARNEGLCETVQGLKFLQSSQRGYTEKQSIDMNTNVSLMDVIAENSCHKVN